MAALADLSECSSAGGQGGQRSRWQSRPTRSWVPGAKGIRAPGQTVRHRSQATINPGAAESRHMHSPYVHGSIVGTGSIASFTNACNVYHHCQSAVTEFNSFPSETCWTTTPAIRAPNLHCASARIQTSFSFQETTFIAMPSLSAPTSIVHASYVSDRMDGPLCKALSLGAIVVQSAMNVVSHRRVQRVRPRAS
ncbi:hypothetical protein J1614_009263 [Plenodomus biglobosus]|nr:hypothetical protein J1614_009263 [Plenodomus biglobosus]